MNYEIEKNRKLDFLIALLGKHFQKLEVALRYWQFQRFVAKHRPEGTPIEFHKNDRHIFYQDLVDRVVGNEPICFLEFGVFKGASIRTWAEIINHPEARFVGFDSFEGLPENWTGTGTGGFYIAKGTFNTNHQMPTADDRRVEFIKGWFQDTLPEFLSNFKPNCRLVVHLDSDLYSSTLFTLISLDRFLRPGSLLIFDEFSIINHEFAAFHDYLCCCPRKFQLVSYRPDFSKLAFEVLQA